MHFLNKVMTFSIIKHITPKTFRELNGVLNVSVLLKQLA